jgi:hypothetical protein
MRSLGARIRKGLVISGSSCDDYGYVPALYRHRGFDEELLERINSCQEQRVIERDYDHTVDPSLWIIFDDLSSDKSVMGSKALKELFSQGRHNEITTIVLCQYFMDLPKSLRTNIDYVILLADKSPANRKSIREQFVSCVKPAQFDRIYSQCTEDFGALVLNNKSKTNEPSDFFSFFRIPEREFIKKKVMGKGRDGVMREKLKDVLPNFDIGVPEYRAYSERHYHNKEREKQRLLADQKSRKKRREVRKKERIRKLAAGQTDVHMVSTIGSDYKSSQMTSNSQLGSEPVMVMGDIRAHDGLEIDTFSHRGDGTESNMWAEPSARSF